MARITWQNVTAPDLETSRLALQQAGNSFVQGFRGFQDTFDTLQQQQQDAYSQEALARLAQVSDPNQLNQMLGSQGLAGLGITDTRYLNADAMTSILGRPKELFDNQNTAANTQSVIEATNRANQIQPLELKRRELANETAQLGIDATNRNETIRVNDAAIRARIGQFKTVEEARLGWGQLEKDLAANPSMFSPAIANLIGGGAVAALSGEENAVKAYDLQVADEKAKADANATMLELYNDPTKLGWDKAMFRQDAMRRFDQGSAELKHALAFIDAQETRLINSDFADEIANDPVLARAAQSLEMERIQLQGEKLRNPLYSSYKILSGEDSQYSGAYTKLTSQLQEAVDDNTKSFWGVSNSRILNYVQDYAKKHPNVPKDLIAMTVLNGASLEARNLFMRNIPFVSDFDLNEAQMDADIAGMMSIYDQQDPKLLQTLLELDAREAALKGKTDRFNELLKRGGREATGTSGYNEADRDRIVAQLILDAQELLGRRLSPEEQTQVEASVNSGAPGFRASNNVTANPVPPQSTEQALGSDGSIGSATVIQGNSPEALASQAAALRKQAKTLPEGSQERIDMMNEANALEFRRSEAIARRNQEARAAEEAALAPRPGDMRGSATGINGLSPEQLALANAQMNADMSAFNPTMGAWPRSVEEALARTNQDQGNFQFNPATDMPPQSRAESRVDVVNAVRQAAGLTQEELSRALIDAVSDRNNVHAPSGIPYNEMDESQLRMIANTGDKKERAAAAAELTIRGMN